MLLTFSFHLIVHSDYFGFGFATLKVLSWEVMIQN